MFESGGKKKTPMDQSAKERIMSSEYEKNDGKATDWSKRAQSAADKNESTSQSETASELKITQTHGVHSC